MPQFSRGPKRKRVLAAAARGLTLARIVGLGPFLWLLVEVSAGAGVGTRAAIVVLYLALALSDFFDGCLARRARATSAFWARADAAADIVFNFSSLAVAAWLGLVGPWVAGGVAVLGGRFLWRAALQPSTDERLPEDRGGKLAGVSYYVLVGWVVLEVATGGIAGRFTLARAGDVVFLYTLVAFWRGRSRPMSSWVPSMKRSV